MHKQTIYEAPRVQGTFTSLEDDREELVRLLNEVRDAVKDIAVISTKHGMYLMSTLSKEIKGAEHSPVEVDEVLKDADKQLWDMAFTISGIERLVTSTEASKMKDNLMENPPHFTANAARELLEKVDSNKDNLADALVKKVFNTITGLRFLPGHETDRTKTRFPNRRKIESKFRYSWMGSLPDRYLEDKYFSLFTDLEMACALVNAGVLPKHPNRIMDKMRDGIRKGEQNFHNDWFSIQCFKNGNTMVEFFNQKTVDNLNSWGSPGDRIA